MSETIEETDHQQSVNDSTVSEVDGSTVTDMSPPTESMILIANVNEAFQRGDIQSARRLIESIDLKALDDDDRTIIHQYKKRLITDPVEIYLPIALFIFWVFIFWKTTH